MGFTCGLVGLPNVGKSTLFNALTSQSVPASNYPFCTIDPNVGVVPLRDERLEKIAAIVGSAKATPTSLEFIDIAGLVKGASTGEGLGNQFLNHIQAVDAIAHVVRCFEDENVAHISAKLDPVNDVDIILTELTLHDLEVVGRNLEKLRAAARTGDPKVKQRLAELSDIHEALARGNPLKKMTLSEIGMELVREINLLTIKPAIYIANVDEKHYKDSPHVAQLIQYASQWNEPCVIISGKLQEEIAQLDADSQVEFLQEWGLDELSLNKIVRAGYQVLNLITFFTANQNEAHAWTVPRGAGVQKAAGKVHSDFEQGFIRAEVIKFADLIEFGSDANLREHGKIAIHGKDYVVEDGDLIFFRSKV
ncbi:MAG: redox-regulated ATPase YchF [Candidatus Zhuqueibacterota bacterium]